MWRLQRHDPAPDHHVRGLHPAGDGLPMGVSCPAAFAAVGAGVFLWAINVVAFYATYIVLGSRMSPTVIIFWRAFTGLQAAVVALGSLVITVVKMGRHE